MVRQGEAVHEQQQTLQGVQPKGHLEEEVHAGNTTEVSHYMEENFLDTVASEQENIWQTTINLCGIATQFKVDTGAGVTAISEGTYQKLGNIQPANT